MKRVLGMAVGLLVALAGTQAYAQINSPPPPLMGQKSYHPYSVPGVMHGFSGLATTFSCTNTGSSAVRVGVELFPDGGGPAINDASATSVELRLPGDTRLFATGSLLWAMGEVDVNNNGVGLVAASARILATSKNVICGAFLTDAVNVPPTSMVPLTIVKKTKQKGD
jgi:hypothetical protein